MRLGRPSASSGMPSRPWRSGTHEAGPSVKTVAIENQAIKPGVGGPQASSRGSGADAVQRMESVRRQLTDAPATSDRQVVQALEVSQPTVSETRKCIWESVDAIGVVTFTDPRGRE